MKRRTFLQMILALPTMFLPAKMRVSSKVRSSDHNKLFRVAELSRQHYRFVKYAGHDTLHVGQLVCFVPGGDNQRVIKLPDPSCDADAVVIKEYRGKRWSHYNGTCSCSKPHDLKNKLRAAMKNTKFEPPVAIPPWIASEHSYA